MILLFLLIRELLTALQIQFIDDTIVIHIL